MSPILHYDTEFDILYLAEKGIEDEVVEIYPGVTLELDPAGVPIGVEVIGALRILGKAIEPLKKRDSNDGIPLQCDLAMLKGLLQSADGGGYKEYVLPPPGDAGAEVLTNIRRVFEPIWKQVVTRPA